LMIAICFVATSLSLILPFLLDKPIIFKGLKLK